MNRAILLVLTALSTVAASDVAGQTSDAECTACHAELELLRQQTTDMASARRMLVTHAEIANSAHSEESCSDCHSGFGSWPHRQAAVTESCASCHEPQDGDWHEGVHSELDSEGVAAASCADCHDVHAVADSTSLVDDGPARVALNVRCVACHETAALPAWDVHMDTVSCASCHAGHETQIAASPDAWVAPAIQMATCGACHEEAAELARADAHGTALLESPPRGLADAALRGADAPASCSACHGGHGVRAIDHPETPVELLNECTACHADEAARYFGTYHGKATALGSHIVATCADCHGAHEIFPSDSAASLLHASRVVETCAECHENSNASFVGYDSHPDPMDRDRNPPLFFSFVFMNGLLFSVLVVFGLHTGLWWVRILIDHRRGAQEADHV